MSDGIIVGVIGKTNNLAINSILLSVPNCKILHVINDPDDKYPLGHSPIPNGSTILCGKNVNSLNVCFNAARTMDAKFLYIMHGFSVLNCSILKTQSIESFCSDSYYSNYFIREPNSAGCAEDFWQVNNTYGMQNLSSFDPILINKAPIQVINLFINMANIGEFDYATPYEFVVGEYTAGNIVRHIPIPLFCINANPYENLNNEVKNKYAKLYI